MKVQIQSIIIEVKNFYTDVNDVFINFEYEKNEKDVKLFLKSFVGKNSLGFYRYSMDLDYLIQDIENYDSEQELINECINSIIPSLSQVIISIDSLIKNQ